MLFKNKSKIVIITLLSFIIVLPISSSADNSIENSAANNLVNLKIMQGYGDGTLRLENKINRSEFTTLIVKMMGYDKDSDLKDYKITLKDVNQNNWAYSFIKAGVKYKLIIGNNENMFNPDNNITYAEALTVIVRALGYESTLKGSWPENVINKAAELGINKNLELESNKQITRGDMSIMIDNALTIDIYG